MTNLSNPSRWSLFGIWAHEYSTGSTPGSKHSLAQSRSQQNAVPQLGPHGVQHGMGHCVCCPRQYPQHVLHSQHIPGFLWFLYDNTNLIILSLLRKENKNQLQPMLRCSQCLGVHRKLVKITLSLLIHLLPQIYFYSHTDKVKT